MKLVRFLEITLGVAIVLLFIGVFIGPANAAAGGPFAGQVFGSAPVECPEGYVCLTEVEYAALVADAESCELLPTFTPTATTTDDDPNETPTPPVDPTSTPPGERARCNRGVGNYEGDCDPGNSSGQGQGGGRPAGEDREEDQGPPGQGSGNDGSHGQGSGNQGQGN